VVDPDFSVGLFAFALWPNGRQYGIISGTVEARVSTIAQFVRFTQMPSRFEKQILGVDVALGVINNRATFS
jgi:hypothetical protein